MVEGRHEGDSPTGGLVQGLAVAGLLRTTIRVRLQDTLGQHEKQALLRAERPEALTGADSPRPSTSFAPDRGQRAFMNRYEREALGVSADLSHFAKAQSLSFVEVERCVKAQQPGCRYVNGPPGAS